MVPVLSIVRTEPFWINKFVTFLSGVIPKDRRCDHRDKAQRRVAARGQTTEQGAVTIDAVARTEKLDLLVQIDL